MRIIGIKRKFVTRPLICDYVKYLMLTIIAFLAVIIPFWMVLINSFKPFGEAIRLGFGLPKVWAAYENYSSIINEGKYGLSFYNSLIITIISIAVLLYIGSMGAWAYARSKALWMNVLYYITIFGVLLPPAIVPSVFLMRVIGISGTRLALILFVIGTRLSLVVFFITGFVKTIPRELEETAEIDGASRIRTFYSIVFPLLRPIIFTVFIILLILVWNDFFASFFMLQGENRITLPLSLYRVSSGSLKQLTWNLIFTHVILVSMPLIIVYGFAQRQVLSGITQGAIKG